MDKNIIIFVLLLFSKRGRFYIVENVILNFLNSKGIVITHTHTQVIGIFHPWGVTDENFPLVRSIFSFQVARSFLITERAKGKLCNKMIETWKLKILRTNWNFEFKSPGMEHDFLSQNKLYFILKTKTASQISFQIYEI